MRNYSPLKALFIKAETLFYELNFRRWPTGGVCMAEVWRDVVGYTGRYEVSNLGNVRNYSTKKLLTPRIEEGYRKVMLCRGALDRKYVKIARLVAEAFIPNPLNLTKSFEPTTSKSQG